MKEFASTIYFYSPKAYEFLRKTLNLPCERMLRKMMAENSVEAGFVEQAFDFLKNETSDCLKDVGLIIDGMSIRSQVSVDHKKNSVRGYVDYGKAADELGITYDKSILATEMLAFQIVSYSDKFKLPIAHFFIKGISAENQSKLIDEAIKKLANVNVIVRSVTCDGTQTNFRTLELLGCNFQKDGSPVTHFKYPMRDSNVYAIMDPCHMLKLCRNSFAETEINSENGQISFKYIEQMNKLQEDEGLKFANKLSRNHVNYKNKKVKVSLAAQTISSGVADAINYLRESGYKQFAGSETICEFIRTFDMLFDMTNSRSAFGKGYKSPISLKKH